MTRCAGATRHQIAGEYPGSVIFRWIPLTGISDRTKATRYSWRAFTDVSENADYIHHLWSDLSQCVLVPARILANKEARCAFVNQLRERIRRPAHA